MKHFLTQCTEKRNEEGLLCYSVVLDILLFTLWEYYLFTDVNRGIFTMVFFRKVIWCEMIINVGSVI